VGFEPTIPVKGILVFLPRKKAERVRFELTVPVKRLQFSKLVHSATLPPLRFSTGRNQRIKILNNPLISRPAKAGLN
jgi:hypothetical protein